MEQHQNNTLNICALIESLPQPSHSLYGESFYTFRLSVPRLSGTVDTLPATASDRVLPEGLSVGDRVFLQGQLRSYNKHLDGANRLVITIFARSIELCDEEFFNEIQLEGYVCKPPVFRTTPFQREITDLLIAVNRSYNKSDYLPCIAWGKNARECAALEVGAKVAINGRVQSREYKKQLQDGSATTRVAYEISVSSIEEI